MQYTTHTNICNQGKQKELFSDFYEARKKIQRLI